MRTTTILCIALGLVLPAIRWARGAEPPKPDGPPPVAAPAAVYFLRDVMPLVNRLGCNRVQCHGEPLGKGGMALSMFGGAAEADYGTIIKDQQGIRIDPLEPAKSLFLLKASGSIPHAGGQKIPPGSVEYKMLLSWIEQGAPYNDEKLPKLVSVHVLPAEQVFEKGQTRQLAVTAVYADGTKQDVTRLAAFHTTDAAVATVEADGKVKAVEFGSAAIAAVYLRQPGVVRLRVPQPLSVPFPALPANNKIDELVFADLKELGFPPAEVAGDEVFLRRVFFDVIGVPPTPEEARAFLADKDPQKRSKLIDRLLGRDEFADFLATKWRDLLRIKAEEPINLWPKAAETYYRWVRESIAANKPYDQFARELLTASGSNFRNGPCNYVRSVPERDPRTLGEATALVFLGARLGCARCHAHPIENWGEDDDLGMAAFFSQIATKFTGEWKEQIVYRNPEGMVRSPQTGKPVAMKPLGAAALAPEPAVDPRRRFAEWLTAPENPWFARNIVNRIWFWLMGRGIVHEPDDLRATNPPANPALLEYLQKELIAHRYDLKHIYRLVLNSKTYQLSSEPTPQNEKDAAHFSHYRSKRLTAEQILDGLSQITEQPERFRQFRRDNTAPTTNIPPDVKASQIAEASETSMLAAMFGRPERGTALERERADDLNPLHVQFLANSSAIEDTIYNCPTIQRLLKDKKGDAEIVEELFLLGLARFPSEAEKQKMVEYLTAEKNRRDRAIHDVLWTLLNSNEFLLNH
jgi:hypothetical protein